MKNSKIKLTVIALMMMLFGTLSTFAQEKQMKEAKHEGHKDREMKQHKPNIPNLTDTQKKQLKEAKIKLQKEVLPLKNELGEKKARLKTLTTTEGSSEKDINKVIEAIGELETTMMKARVSNKMGIKKFLTEEQRLFVDSHQSMGKRKHKMRH